MIHKPRNSIRFQSLEVSGGSQNLRIPEWREILNIHIAQSGKAWDMAALAPPEMPRKAGVHMKPHRRAELVTRHPSSYQTGKFLKALTQCSGTRACVLEFFT